MVSGGRRGGARRGKAMPGQRERMAPAHDGGARARIFRQDENLFDAKSFGEPAVVRALQGKRGTGRFAGAAPGPASKAPVAPPRDDLTWLTMAYLEPIRDRLLQFAEDHDGPRASFAQLIAKAERSLQRTEELEQGIGTKYDGGGVKRAGPFATKAARKELSGLLALLRESKAEDAREVAQLRRPSLRGSDRVALARALATWIERRLATFSEVDAILTKHLADIERASFDGDGSDIVALVTEGIAWVAAVLGAKTLVPPLELWKQRSSVLLMRRSGETEVLDRAVNHFHRAELSDAPFRGVMPATHDDALTLAFAHVKALQTHLRRAETLQEAVAAWRKGRDEATSRRAPAVAMVLEVPLGAELRRLWLGLALLLLRVEMSMRLDELHNLHRGIAAAEERAAVVIQRAVRTRRLKQQGAPPLEALKQRLIAYLEAASPDFSTDQLLHGRKKTLLRGERFPVFEVAEPAAKEPDE